MNFSLKSSILAATVLSLVASGCYYNPPVDREKDAKDKQNKTDDQETFAPTFNPCEGDNPPAKCTASSPDDATAWSPAFDITFMVFDAYGTFPKVVNPTSAYSSYFDELGSSSYSLVFEVVGFDESKADEQQNVYINIWPAGLATKNPSTIKVKRGWLWNLNSFGYFSKNILKATIKKDGMVYSLKAPKQTIRIPLSSTFGNAPTIEFRDATLSAGLQWFETKKVFSLNGGEIKGILTKESYQKSLVWSARSCGDDCIQTTSATTCQAGSKLQNCPVNCGPSLQYCVQGPSLLNLGFTTTLDGKPYAGATASLTIIGGGVTITGIED